MAAVFPSLHRIEHPLIEHKLTCLRDKSRSTRECQTLLREITLLMTYEIARDLPLTRKTVETPVGTKRDAGTVDGESVVVVPILRAGLVMAQGLLDLLPPVRTGHIGLHHGPQLDQPIEYVARLPRPDGRLFIVVDPLVATGRSACRAVKILNRHGVEDRNIRFVSLIVAPEGLTQFTTLHPSIQIYAAAVDEGVGPNTGLTATGDICPGLGDISARLFGE